MGSEERDARFRVQVFKHLPDLTFGQPDTPVRWAELTAFQFEGTRAPLIGASGIWKPKVRTLPISVTTAPPKPDRSTTPCSNTESRRCMGPS